MTSNVGITDRIFRFILAGGLLFLGLNVYPDSALGIGLIVVGAISALTGIFGFCGLYKIFGINTRKIDRNTQV